MLNSHALHGPTAGSSARCPRDLLRIESQPPMVVDAHERTSSRSSSLPCHTSPLPGACATWDHVPDKLLAPSPCITVWFGETLTYGVVKPRRDQVGPTLMPSRVRGDGFVEAWRVEARSLAEV